MLLSVVGRLRPRVVRDQRGRPDGGRVGPPRGEHHLRRGHRRRPRRRGAGHRHRCRLRRRSARQAARRRVGSTRSRSPSTETVATAATPTADSPAASESARERARPVHRAARAQGPAHHRLRRRDQRRPGCPRLPEVDGVTRATRRRCPSRRDRGGPGVRSRRASRPPSGRPGAPPARSTWSSSRRPSRSPTSRLLADLGVRHVGENRDQEAPAQG